MHEIRPGQVYAACHPLDDTLLRIQSYTPGDARARVTDLAGRRPRWILVTSLHPTGVTKTGRPRRTGYRLVQDGQAGDAPREDGKHDVINALDDLEDLLAEHGFDELSDEELDTLDAWANNIQLDIARYRRTRNREAGDA